VNLPEGNYIITAQALGYKAQDIEIIINRGTSQEINFDLEPDVLGLNEVTVTGNRNEINRHESPVIINTLSATDLSITQSSILSEGLNFSPGIRTENNCQNCGFNQVRMNGMEGPYSQILINSRPIFSGLAGVYGLELIPANMLERIEVVRGGGSALYGSNAIAGTINLILKDPISNTYEFGATSNLLGIGLNDISSPINDYRVHMNTSLISSDAKSGMTVYGFFRTREPFDANNDGFSELSKIKNITAGSRFFYRTGNRGKISADLFVINEDRRGGNKFDLPMHQTDITEAVNHNITSVALNFDQFVRKHDKLSVYVSGQHVDRDSYYGANQSLSDYGKTNDFSYAAGALYNYVYGNMNVSLGIENIGSWLKDTKLGYPDLENYTGGDINHTDNVLIAQQMLNTTGIYAQYELKLEKFNLTTGARFDNYNVLDLNNEGNNDKTGNVLSPRLSIMYDFMPWLQCRLSYAQGYRTPQIYDEDLHIETSGSRRVIHTNSPDLKPETSHSISASIDTHHSYGDMAIEFLAEGFYTVLQDPFANEFGTPDNEGTVIYTRINADGTATVQGVNLELKTRPIHKLTLTAGYTFQKSEYSEEQEFDEKLFLRTPNQYGFLSIDYKLFKHFGLSVNGIQTGKMLVPYFGPLAENPDIGELRESPNFFDLGFKVRYTIKLNGMCLQIFTGVKNLFNSYQNDFDTGIMRDPGYIYGPSEPRTIYFGFKLGNGKMGY
jgi:outer membrane receptor for ferrienterochelin and colicins